MKVYRVQDADGRGPWKPGFSHKWMDADIGKRATLPTWIEEFGFGCLMRVRGEIKRGKFCGSCCDSQEQVWKWFTRPEMDRLHILGHHLVELEVDEIIAQSKNQGVLIRSRPLYEDVRVIE